MQRGRVIRENSRTEKQPVALHEHARANRPERDDLPIANHSARLRCRVETPQQPPVLRREAIHLAVIRAGIHAPVRHRGREPHWPAREKPPPHPPRARVERIHLMIHRRAEEDRAADSHRVERVVELHLRHLRVGLRVRPRRLRHRGRAADPVLGQRQPQRFRGHAAAGVVVHISRPVPGRRGGQREPKNRGHNGQAAPETSVPSEL